MMSLVENSDHMVNFHHKIANRYDTSKCTDKTKIVELSVTMLVALHNMVVYTTDKLKQTTT